RAGLGPTTSWSSRSTPWSCSTRPRPCSVRDGRQSHQPFLVVAAATVAAAAYPSAEEPATERATAPAVDAAHSDAQVGSTRIVLGRALRRGCAVTKEEPGFWTRRRGFVQVKRGSNIQLLSFSLVASA